MTVEKRTEPNGLIVEEEDKHIFTQHPQSSAMVHEPVHQIRFRSGKETFEFNFGYTGQTDFDGKDTLSNDFKFTYNGRRCKDLFALDKKFLPDDLFLQMAENFPPRNEQADINKSLEHRLMKVDTSNLSEEKLKETKERLQKISDKGHLGATVSLVNILVNEYSALPEDKKVERANLARKIVTLSDTVREGDKTGFCMPNLAYALMKNEEIAFLPGINKKDAINTYLYNTFVKDPSLKKLGEMILGKAPKGTNIQDEASAYNKRTGLGLAMVGIPAAIGGFALFAAINGPAITAAAGGALALAVYDIHKDRINGFFAAAKKTLMGR